MSTTPIPASDAASGVELARRLIKAMVDEGDRGMLRVIDPARPVEVGYAALYLARCLDALALEATNGNKQLARRFLLDAATDPAGGMAVDVLGAAIDEAFTDPDKEH